MRSSSINDDSKSLAASNLSNVSPNVRQVAAGAKKFKVRRWRTEAHADAVRLVSHSTTALECDRGISRTRQQTGNHHNQHVASAITCDYIHYGRCYTFISATGVFRNIPPESNVSHPYNEQTTITQCPPGDDVPLEPALSQNSHLSRFCDQSSYFKSPTTSRHSYSSSSLS